MFLKSLFDSSETFEIDEPNNKMKSMNVLLNQTFQISKNVGLGTGYRIFEEKIRYQRK